MMSLRNGMLAALGAVGVIAGLVWGAGRLTPPVKTVDFRIDTDLFVGGKQGDESKPNNQVTTLFRGGVVYDFMSSPERVAIYDPQRHRFILLDPKQRTKVEIREQQLTQYVDHIRKWAADQDDPLLNFLADPKFEESFDEEQGELKLSAKLYSYTVTTEQPTRVGALQQYRRFTDWYARLNSATNPGAMPPTGRLALNRALSQHQVIPKSVRLTIRSSRSGGLVTIRTTHRTFWSLATSDLERIEKADAQLAVFTAVPLKDFVAAAEKDVRQVAVKKAADSRK
jgi:hypothetical protein